MVPSSWSLDGQEQTTKQVRHDVAKEKTRQTAAADWHV